MSLIRNNVFTSLSRITVLVFLLLLQTVAWDTMLSLAQPRDYFVHFEHPKGVHLGQQLPLHFKGAAFILLFTGAMKLPFLKAKVNELDSNP